MFYKYVMQKRSKNQPAAMGGLGLLEWSSFDYNQNDTK